LPICPLPEKPPHPVLRTTLSRLARGRGVLEADQKILRERE
jgi:hypothetical protein